MGVKRGQEREGEGGKSGWERKGGDVYGENSYFKSSLAGLLPSSRMGATWSPFCPLWPLMPFWFLPFFWPFWPFWPFLPLPATSAQERPWLLPFPVSEPLPLPAGEGGL